jgi:dTDP-4-amino-4,6-dideoxygalactose transaminase
VTDLLESASRGASVPFLPWNTPLLGAEEIEEVVDTLRSGWLTSGPKAARFEAAVRELTGAPAAFAVTSCTAALHLALLAGGIQPGDEVITPSLTFCAALNVIVQVGAVPVFVDIQPHTLNVDPELVDAAVTGRTRALLIMHYGGHPCEMDQLRQIAGTAGLLLVEDAAHAIGAAYRGQPAGSFGDLAAFSFYANKNITTGEGGMLVGRADLVEKARLLGRHGIDRSAWQRHGNRGHADYDVVDAGLKYNLPDILAAIGIHQVRRLPDMIARRRWIAEEYSRCLADLPGLLLPATSTDVEHAWHLYQVQVDPSGAGLDRAELAARLAAAGIGTSIHFTPVHQLTRYRGMAQPGALAHTERAAARLLSLPCYPAMTDADVHRVVDAVRAATANSGRRAGEPAC